MSLQEFLKVRTDQIEKGGFAVVTDTKIPMNMIYFVGSAHESAKVHWGYELAEGLGEMIAETLEFLERKKIHIVALAVHPDFEMILTGALKLFADPESAQIVEEDEDF